MEHVMNLAMSETKGKVQRGSNRKLRSNAASLSWFTMLSTGSPLASTPHMLDVSPEACSWLFVYFPLCRQQGRQLAHMLTSPLSMR